MMLETPPTKTEMSVRVAKLFALFLEWTLDKQELGENCAMVDAVGHCCSNHSLINQRWNELIYRAMSLDHTGVLVPTEADILSRQWWDDQGFIFPDGYRAIS